MAVQHQIFLICYIVYKILLTKTVLSLNWSFKKLKAEMVQYTNDILEKRKRLKNITNRLTINITYSPNDKNSELESVFFCSESNKLGYAINICSFSYLNHHLYSYLYILNPGS